MIAGLREEIGYSLTVDETRTLERTLAKLREELGARTFEEAWEEGRTLPLEQAIDLACR